MKREHLFITTKHFETCNKFKIYGVGKSSINQLGLVNKGDIAFFLNKQDNLLIGPYGIVSEVFYNDDIIWQEKNGIDAYPYRVKLQAKIIFSIDGNMFSQIIEENHIRIDSSDLNQKSVFTLLPKDCKIIEKILKNKGKKIKNLSSYSNFQETPITVKFAQSQGFTEAFLEYFILKNFAKFFKNSFSIPYNQFRINLLGSKIDIIALDKKNKNIFVIELKKDLIKNDDIVQLEKYVNWVKNNIKLLKTFFNINLNNSKIYSFIIGSSIQKDLSIKSDNNISIKIYELKDNKLNLSSLFL